MSRPAPVATLAALAFAVSSAATGAAADNLIIKDEAISVALGVQLQSRLQIATASNATGGNFDVVQGRDGKSDDVDFSLRRARLFLRGTVVGDWRFLFSYTTERLDAGGYEDARAANLYFGWVAKDWKVGDLVHSARGGFDWAFFNRAGQISSSLLFPTGRPAAALLNSRGVGIGYRLSGARFDAGIDVQNGRTGPTKANANEAAGVFASARVEFTALGGKKLAYTESFLGKPGSGLLLCAEAAIDDDNQGTAGQSIDTTGAAVEAIGHWNALSVFAEARLQNRRSSALAGGASTTIKAQELTLQGGWAFPLANGHIIEPALRAALIDLDTGNDDERVAYDTPTSRDSESGNSGQQVDLGVNWYIAGHSNKLQAALTWWEAEDGDGDATIVRVQHQLSF